MKQHHPTRFLSVCSAACMLVAGIAIQSCKKSEPPVPPTPSVSVSTPLVHEVMEWDVYTGRLESPRMVNLSARVSGLIEQAPFKEGAIVHEGDLLFVIDPRPFKADLDSAHANVARAKALYAQADVHFKRYDKIHATKAISAEDYDQAAASLRETEAQLAAAIAAEQKAQLNLDWTRVTAPLDGRISRKLITEGNLVNGGSGQAALLTTITSIDPLYCYFNVPERAFLKYQALKNEQIQSGQQSTDLPCYIQLENETSFSHEGTLDFVDNSIDAGTGTILLRCSLPNHHGKLTPGLFARMRISGGKKFTAVLVPDAAIGTDQNSRFVLVVGQDNIAQQRAVKIGALFGSLRAVTDGIGSTDRVIVNGMQAARPGTAVAPAEVPITEEMLNTGTPGTPVPTIAQPTPARPAGEQNKAAK